MSVEQASAIRTTLGLAAGIAAFTLVLILPPPVGMTDAAWSTVAVAALMAIWWISEALPVAATALAPLVAFPLLGVAPIGEIAAPFADPVIFLFLGSLTIGLAVERWDLHRRIALAIISWFGLRPDRLILGFMLATALLSMWVSNTATAAMMLPVCISTVALLVGPPEAFRLAGREQAHFAIALLTGVAFAASIGGLATLIGTPPNALFVAFMRRTYEIEIGFGQWMLVGVPVATLSLIGTWAIITRIAYRVGRTDLQGAQEHLRGMLGAQGALSRPQILVAIVFAATAMAWVARPFLNELLPGLTDAGIALTAALALFAIPSGRGGGLIDWTTMKRLPWGVLVLFGGGLSLASAIASTGLADWLGAALAGLGSIGIVTLVAAAIVLTIGLSELASNTATAATLLPVIASISDAIGLGPYALTVPVALAASGGLMLPVATPPNALFFSSGYIKASELARAGALADILNATIILVAAFTIVKWVFG